METSDKIVIGATAVILASTITMLAIGKKYDRASTSVLSELQDIHYTLSKSREDIISGNKSIVEGNMILRTIVQQGAKNVTTK